MKIVYTLFFFVFFGNLFSQFSSLSTNSFNQVQTFVANRFTEENMAGLSVGIIKNGEVVFLRGYGYANLEDSTVATEFTSFRIASVSKFITAVLALQVANEGFLDLNEDVRNYVPEFPVKPEGAITSKHLLYNQSGITHYNQCTTYSSTNLHDYVSTYTNEYNPIAAIDIFKDVPLCFVPGTDYHYSTFGFNLLAAVIERAGPGSYLEKFNSYIKCPSGMYGLYSEIQGLRPFPNEASWYRVVNGEIQAPANSIDLTDVSFKTGGGGFTGTVIDMVKFMRAYVNRELLNDSLITLMHTVPSVNSAEGVNYAMGTYSALRNGQRLIFHSGSQTGAASMLYFSPENKNGVILLSNTQNINLFPLARDIYDFLPQATTNGNAWDDDNFEIAIDIDFNVENTQAIVGSFVVGGTPPYDYYWSNYDTSDFVLVEVDTNLSLTVTDKFFCSQTLSIQVVFGENEEEPNTIHQSLTASSVKLYPNPAKSNEQIIIDNVSIPFNIKVLDLSGKLVFEKFSNESHFNITPISTGVYLLVFDFEDGKQLSKKLVIGN